MDDYSSDLNTMETVLPALLGLSTAAVLSAVAYICAKHLRARNKKLTHDTSYPFQATRRPTAVRSPIGQPPHYLKKSPSPTGAKKIGIIQPAQDQNVSNTTTPTTPQTTKLVEEDEIRPKVVNEKESVINKSPVEIESPANDMPNIWDYGKLGTIFFKLRYLKERSALVVSIIRCRGLPCKTISVSGNYYVPAGINGRTQAATDPYVKLQLLPEKEHKVKTRVVRNTRNPVYDEDFTFYGLNIHELGSMTLHFVILSFDRYSRDDVIGEVVWPLSSISLREIEQEHMSISKEIHPRSLKIRAQGRGELLISLCWQPAAGRLTVVLLKARNLPRMDVTGLADPYVKIYLLYDRQRIAKKKTHVKKRTLSPVFNESFAFDIPTAEGTGATLDGISLELMLLDWDRVTKNEVIGQLELGGPNSSGTALNHWNEVCNSPRRQIAEWHKLNEQGDT